MPRSTPLHVIEATPWPTRKIKFRLSDIPDDTEVHGIRNALDQFRFVLDLQFRDEDRTIIVELPTEQDEPSLYNDPMREVVTWAIYRRRLLNPVEDQILTQYKGLARENEDGRAALLWALAYSLETCEE